MIKEKKSLTAENLVPFTSPKSDLFAETMFPTRNASNKKIEVTELFTHFTANIINEDVPFTR